MILLTIAACKCINNSASVSACIIIFHKISVLCTCTVTLWGLNNSLPLYNLLNRSSQEDGASPSQHTQGSMAAAPDSPRSPSPIHNNGAMDDSTDNVQEANSPKRHEPAALSLRLPPHVIHSKGDNSQTTSDIISETKVDKKRKSRTKRGKRVYSCAGPACEFETGEYCLLIRLLFMQFSSCDSGTGVVYYN